MEVTGDKIRSIEIFTFGKNGLEPAVNAELENGQIVFLNGYGQDEFHHERQAIYGSEETSFGKMYKTVNLDTFELRRHEAYSIRNIKDKFGIGIYYFEGDMASGEEITNALQRNKELEVVWAAERVVAEEKARAKESARKERLEDLLKNGINEIGEYHTELYTKDIARLVREKLKKEYPKVKLSIRTEYSKIDVSVMQAPEAVMLECEGNYMQLNHYRISEDSRLTDYGRTLCVRIHELFNSFNYDNSDIMTDYYDVNFYFGLSIGRWDKPFQIKS